MKMKAMLLAILLGTASLSGCHAIEGITEADVKDWDTPLEMLGIGEMSHYPTVCCSEHINEKYSGEVRDNKRLICELLKKQTYKKSKQFEPTSDHKYVSYKVITPYYEGVTVNRGGLTIYENGEVLLTVLTGKRVYPFYYKIDKDSAEAIYTEAEAYIKERIELEKVCESNAREDLKIENFVSILRADEDAKFSAYINRLDYKVEGDSNLIDLVANASYAKANQTHFNYFSFSAYASKYDDSYGYSDFMFHISDDYSVVWMIDAVTDNYDLEHTYSEFYSIDPNDGKNIYDTAMDLVRAAL